MDGIDRLDDIQEPALPFLPPALAEALIWNRADQWNLRVALPITQHQFSGPNVHALRHSTDKDSVTAADRVPNRGIQLLDYRFFRNLKLLRAMAGKATGTRSIFVVSHR